MDGGERHALGVCEHHLLLAHLAAAVAAPSHAAAVDVHGLLLVAEAGSQRLVELLLVALGVGLVDPVLLGPLKLLVGAEEPAERRRRVADVESHGHIHRHDWAGHR